MHTLLTSPVRKTLFGVLIVLLALGGFPASAEGGLQTDSEPDATEQPSADSAPAPHHRGDRAPRKFKAKLTGLEEVPNPVETETNGVVRLHINRAETKITFRMVIRKADGILGVAGAHIHCGPTGENGPVVAFLAGVFPGGLDGRVEVEGTIDVDNILDPSCGETVAEVAESMRAGNTYVNVHSLPNPSGEVRGQIKAR